MTLYYQQVTLYKDSQIMSNSLVKSGRKDKYDIYSITIGGITESDYGNYSCVARNSLGTSTDSLKITGNKTHRNKDSYILI